MNARPFLDGLRRSCSRPNASREVKISGERWPEEKHARVKRMWLEGWSASVVAAEIGVTRNAVIGKMTRLEIRRPDHVGKTARGL
jgi:hypothetical protein